MSASAFWRPLAYALLAACALAATSTRFDETEVGACIAVFGFALLGESCAAFAQRRRSSSPARAELAGGATFRTVTVYLCGGDEREVVTENPPPADVTLEEHLALHNNRVIDDADANGCA